MEDSNGTWLTSVQITPSPAARATVLLPCGHWYAWLSPADVQACQTAQVRRLPHGLRRRSHDQRDAGPVRQLRPVPESESGLTVLAGQRSKEPEGH